VFEPLVLPVDEPNLNDIESTVALSDVEGEEHGTDSGNHNPAAEAQGSSGCREDNSDARSTSWTQTGTGQDLACPSRGRKSHS